VLGFIAATVFPSPEVVFIMFSGDFVTLAALITVKTEIIKQNDMQGFLIKSLPVIRTLSRLPF
jgi:hypothetical protein